MPEGQQLSAHPYVECKQGVCGGRPVLKGTRFPGQVCGLCIRSRAMTERQPLHCLAFSYRVYSRVI